MNDDPHRAELRRALRERLGRPGEPVRILAEDVLGEEDGVIDWVAVEPTGRALLGLLSPATAAASLLSVGLAQRAWVEARLADWLKLSPSLGVRPDLRPRLLLVAPDFPRPLCVAAREADPEGIRLARFAWNETGALGLEPVSMPVRPRARATTPGYEPLAAFRTGLGELDLELTPEERSSLL